MTDSGYVQVKEPAVRIPDWNSFSVIGDPGCDGQGAGIMSTFAKALAAGNDDFAVIFFHIPPPNRISGNSVSLEAWEPVRHILKNHRARIQYIVTGGGGARIEFVHKAIGPAVAYHHIVRFHLEGQSLRHTHITLRDAEKIHESILAEAIRRQENSV